MWPDLELIGVYPSRFSEIRACNYSPVPNTTFPHFLKSYLGHRVFHLSITPIEIDTTVCDFTQQPHLGVLPHFYPYDHLTSQ